MKKLIPTQDFVAMEIPKFDTAISLPDGVKIQKDSHFVAIAVGPDVKKIAVGDKIVAFNQSMLKVKLDDREYFVAKEEFIIGIIQEVEE